MKQPKFQRSGILGCFSLLPHCLTCKLDQPIKLEPRAAFVRSFRSFRQELAGAPEGVDVLEDVGRVEVRGGDPLGGRWSGRLGRAHVVGGA